MNSNRRRIVRDIRGSISGAGFQTVVAGLAGHGRGQASIAPREGCG